MNELPGKTNIFFSPNIYGFKTSINNTLIHICNLIFEKRDFPKNDFDKMLTFNCSRFHQFVQEVNEMCI